MDKNNCRNVSKFSDDLWRATMTIIIDVELLKYEGCEIKLWMDDF